MTAKILVADDDPEILSLVRRILEDAGYEVLAASDGVTAKQLTETEDPDLLILDVMMPGLSGIDVCRAIRLRSTVPIIFLTALGEQEHLAKALDLGADDYITKPFRGTELLARTRAVLRRVQEYARQTQQRLRFGELEIDLTGHTVHKGGQPVHLDPKEFDLLACMASNPDRVFSREELLEKVWGYDYLGQSRVVDVTIHRLRSKIEDNPKTPRYILTVRGAGYKFSSVGT
jgi:two-component system response regulator MtrA